MKYTMALNQIARALAVATKSQPSPANNTILALCACVGEYRTPEMIAPVKHAPGRDARGNWFSLWSAIYGLVGAGLTTLWAWSLTP